MIKGIRIPGLSLRDRRRTFGGTWSRDIAMRHQKDSYHVVGICG